MTYRPRYEEVSNEERVRIMLEDTRKRWDAPANDSVIVGTLGEGTATREQILKAIDRLGDERRIILAPAVQAALDAAKARHPLNNFNAYAFENIALDKCEELKWDLTAAQNLSDIFDWMLEQQDVPLTDQGREAQQQLRGVEKRTREINEITANYTQGFKLRTPNGGVKVFDRDGHEVQFSAQGGRAKPRDGGFDAMTDDEISAIVEQLRTERRMRSMTKEGLRAEINPVMKANYAARSTSMGEHPLGTELVNPDDGTVFTDRRALIHWINLSASNAKRLLTRRGQIDPTLKAAFEALINS